MTAVYNGKIREIGSSYVISIPYKMKITGNHTAQWINSGGNIEVAVNKKGMKYSNGLIVFDSVFEQGGSQSMIIHPTVLYMYGLGRRAKSNIVKLWINKNGNIEIRPHITKK